MSMQPLNFNLKGVTNNNVNGDLGLSNKQDASIPQKVIQESEHVEKISGKINELNNNSTPDHSHNFNSISKDMTKTSESNMPTIEENEQDDDSMDLFDLADEMIEEDMNESLSNELISKGLEKANIGLEKANIGEEKAKIGEEKATKAEEFKSTKEELPLGGSGIKIGNRDLLSLSEKETAEIMKESVKKTKEIAYSEFVGKVDRAILDQIFSNIEKNLDKTMVPKTQDGKRVIQDGKTLMVQGQKVSHEQFVQHFKNNEVSIFIENTLFMHPGMPGREDIGEVAIVREDGSIIEDLIVEELTQEEVEKFSKGISEYFEKKGAPVVLQRPPEDPSKKDDKKIVHDNISAHTLTPPAVKNGKSEHRETIDHKCVLLLLGKSDEMKHERASKERHEQEAFNEKAEKTARIIKFETLKFEQIENARTAEEIKKDTSDNFFLVNYPSTNSKENLEKRMTNLRGKAKIIRSRTIN